MAQMSPNQARAVDPILTAVARGYGSPNARVADALFPFVLVGQRAGKILSFGPDSFRLVNSARAPGANTKRVQYGYETGDFSLVDHRLEGLVPVELQEEAQAVPGIDLGANAVNMVQDSMANEREKQAADLATDVANYATGNKYSPTGTSKWSDPTSDPFTDVNAAKEAVRSQIGKKPNRFVLAPKVLMALRTHPKILDRLSTATDRNPATLAQLQALFEIESIIEAEAMYYDGNAFKDMWNKDAVLAYTTPASMAQMGSPSFGYTYRLSGRPIVEDAYFEENVQSWIYPVKDAYKAVLVGATAGFLVKGAVA
jgi:hypothetical protein